MSHLEVPTGPAFAVELSVLAGPSAGLRQDIRRFPAVIGRGRDADVRLEDDLDDPRLSRAHLRVTVQGGRIVVADLSTNGTWVGDRQLESNVPYPLQGGEAIWLGTQTRIELRVLGGGGAPASAASLDAGPPAPMAVDPIPLRLHLLGRVQVAVGGAVIPDSAWTARKALALLAFLAESRGRPVPVERIEETLWPDAEESPRTALQTAVSRLRRAFRGLPGEVPDPVCCSQGAYALSDRYDVRCDVPAFEAACQQARRKRGSEDAEVDLQEALRLYRDELLPGLSDDWVVGRRRALQRLHLEAAEALALLRLEQSRPDEAVDVLQPMVAADPCREQAQLLLMRGLAATGRREEALRQYQSCVRALKRSLGIGPGPELLAWYEGMHQLPL